VKCRIIFDPSLMYNLHYYNGVIFQLSSLGKNTKDVTVLGAGGRYDELVAKFAPPSSPSVCAVGVNLALENIIIEDYRFSQTTEVLFSSF